MSRSQERLVSNQHKPAPAWPFWCVCGVITGCYVLFIVALIVADTAYSSEQQIIAAFADTKIRFAVWLSLISCGFTALLSLWTAVPAGYLLSRWAPRNRWERGLHRVVEGIIDIPIVLPPLVIGISLLILFRTAPGIWFETNVLPVTYEVAGLVLAQYTVGCAFAVRAMRNTFAHIPARPELIARSLGASQSQAFWDIAFPASRRGMISAASLAWARSMGEFGPVLVFAGATRMKTEVLPTTVFLELSVGNLHNAVTVSLLMVLLAVIVLLFMRLFGEGGHSHDRM